MNRITPPPWRLVGNCYIYASNDALVAEVRPADAPLIVNAPRMLKALKAVRLFYSQPWGAAKATEWEYLVGDIEVSEENLFAFVDRVIAEAGGDKKVHYMGVPCGTPGEPGTLRESWGNPGQEPVTCKRCLAHRERTAPQRAAVKALLESIQKGDTTDGEK